MKNFLKFLGAIVMVAIIGFSMTACSNGGGGGGDNNNVIPSEWTGTYVGGSASVTLNGNGSVVAAGWDNFNNGTYTGFGISAGGTVSGGGYSGTWVYLTQDGVNIGVIVHYSPALNGKTYSIAGGKYGGHGVPELISVISALDASFSPSGNWSNDYWFNGEK